MLASTSPSAMDNFTEGIHLFNATRYWDAHEHWEECWRGVAEPDATFFKGIIQTAAALVHWQRGNLRGLQRNWHKARPKLVATTGIRNQIALARLVNDMDAFVMADGCISPPQLYTQGASRSKNTPFVVR